MFVEKTKTIVVTINRSVIVGIPCWTLGSDDGSW